MLDPKPNLSTPASARDQRSGAVRGRRVRAWRPALTVAIVALTFAAGIAFGNYASDAQLLTTVRQSVKAAIARGERDASSFANWRTITTHLHDIETVSIALPPSEGWGGAVAGVGDDIIYVSPYGEFGWIDAAGRVTKLPLRTPMNVAGLRARTAEAKNFNPNYFRTTDMLVEPRGADGLRVFVGHHRYVDNCVELWLSTIDLTKKNGAIDPASGTWRTLYRAKPCVTFNAPTFYTLFEGHFSGGRIVRLDADHLLFSVGDHGWDGQNGRPQTPQDLNVDLGKILKIDTRTGAAEMFAMGLRNSQGLLVDTRGRIWETEHGPKGGDELNLIVKDGNYGWPLSTYGVQYGGRPWPFSGDQGRHRFGIAPHYSWIPSIGISNLVEVTGDEFPRWKGDLLIGSLVDNGLWRVRLDGDRVAYTERIGFEGERLRDVEALPNGRIALLTDSRRLILIRRAPVERTLARRESEAAPAALPVARSVSGSAGRALFQANCVSCHTMDGAPSVGPSLGGVVGRKVGGAPEFPYSEALAARSETWDHARLERFLLDPRGEYPGTLMSRLPLSPKEAEQIVDYLEETR